jgi:hypothetical protein
MRIALLVCLLSPALCSRCLYGVEPGHWQHFDWVDTPGRGSTADYNRLDSSAESLWLQTSVEPETTPFGSAYQTFKVECRLRNVLGKYWTQDFFEHKTIVLIGDSSDAHFLDFLCITYHTKGFTGWRAFVHSHHTINYCTLPSGLMLVQVYLLRANHHADHNVIQVVNKFFNARNDSHTYEHFDGTDRRALDGRADDVEPIMRRKPDLIVVSSAYWSLHHFVSQHTEEVTPSVMPEAYVLHYIATTKDLVQTTRAHFPATRILVHTSPEIRTDCAHGARPNSDGSHKHVWGKRAYVAQLNAALRFSATELGVELVDYELISKAFQPSQLTIDGVHHCGTPRVCVN